MLTSLRPLRSRNFALVWTSALVSNVGLVDADRRARATSSPHRSHDPLWTGAVAAAAFIPIGVLSPLGGALADRLDRRRWLIVTTLAEAVFAALLAVLAATGPRTVVGAGGGRLPRRRGRRRRASRPTRP